MSERSRFAAALIAVLLLPLPARAHGALPGLDGFYVGLLHPLTTPHTALVLLATALLIGQGREPAFRRFWPPFAVMLVAGLLFGLWLRVGPELAPALLLVALVGGATAAVRPAAVLATGAVAVLGGVLAGLAAAPDAGTLQATLVTLAGSLAGANVVLILLVQGFVLLLEMVEAPWVPVALRVLGSWIAAVALLMLAFAFAKWRAILPV